MGDAWRAERRRGGKTLGARRFNDKKMGSTERAYRACLTYNKVLAKRYRDGLSRRQNSKRRVCWKVIPPSRNYPQKSLRLYLTLGRVVDGVKKRQSISQDVGPTENPDIKRIRRAYKELFAYLNAYNQELEETGIAPFIDKKDYNIRGLIQKFPVDTDFITKEYVQKIAEEKKDV